jgi:hypothetical protein
VDQVGEQSDAVGDHEDRDLDKGGGPEYAERDPNGESSTKTIRSGRLVPAQVL